MLSDNQGKILIRLARRTIGKHLGVDMEPEGSAKALDDPVFQEKMGVFVTLNRRGVLRGCIGSLVGAESLADGVRRHAINAAFHDYRFPPLTVDELEGLHIDISVLTEPQPLEYRNPDELRQLLRPGVDGVILDGAGGRGATFLPQVWKQLPAVEDFLGHLCRKAGLEADYWKRSHPRIQTYQAQYFEEEL